MHAISGTWQFWAMMAAVFAALTAIFAKVGVDGMGHLIGMRLARANCHHI